MNNGPEEEAVKSFKLLKEKDIVELTGKQAKAGKYDDLIKFGKDYLKETDSSSSVFHAGKFMLGNLMHRFKTFSDIAI